MFFWLIIHVHDICNYSYFIKIWRIAPWKLHVYFSITACCCAIITVYGFLLPSIHKQWTIPAYLLAELLLLHTPCLSESTHLKFNRSFVEEKITSAMNSVNYRITETKFKVPCPYIADHLCTKPGSINAKWRRNYPYSFRDVRWKKLTKLFLQPLCCITGIH